LSCRCNKFLKNNLTFSAAPEERNINRKRITKITKAPEERHHNDAKGKIE
jgi:hypothetical protein